MLTMTAEKEIHDLVDTIEYFVNTHTREELRALGYAFTRRVHRTLQQELFGDVMLTAIYEWASKVKTGNHDLRNEATCETCAKIVRALGDPKPGMPFI